IHLLERHLKPLNLIKLLYIPMIDLTPLFVVTLQSRSGKTGDEWEDRRRKGLCFSCGQKYSPQHKCSEGTLRILLLAEGDEADDNGEIRLAEAILDEEADGECLALELNGYSTVSSSNLKTIKLAGELNGIPILILIDSRATHNFISKKLAIALGLTIKPVKRLQISLGNGSRVWIGEHYDSVSIQFGSYSCIVDALVYNLGSLDMILGIAWLGTLGDVLFNWQTRQVRFLSQGNYIQLQGVSSNLDNHSSLQTCLNGQIDQVSMELDPPSALNEEQLSDLSALLSQFSMLFQAPQGLPPPICVRPYRYPHLHKDEIQRQVEEMLHTGIIRVSQSAYSSPVILVKKKDSSWRLCIDYRATIPDKGVSMDPTKIESITYWPTPKNVKVVRGMDSCGVRKQSTFENLKKIMASAPVLALPNFSQPFEIECDASGRGIGAVLMQSQRPIAYFSKALSDQNLSKSAYEKEIMALVLAIQHWRPYLLGRSFTVFTDQSLKFLLEQRITTIDQQNWVAKLLGYQFTICYKPGKENRVADALSRIPEVGELYSIVAYPQWLDGTQLLDGLKDDPQLQKIVQEVTNDPQSRPGFSLVNGKLYHKERLVIPATSPWIPQLLEEFHSSPNGGHSGFYRTYLRLASRIYWLGMTKSVREFVRAYKSSTLSPAGLLQPLPIPDGIWEDISIDFITGLPKSKGYEVILMVVDQFIRLHGIPKSLLSDRDPLFLSTFWKEIFSLQGSKLKFSSAYHPETDGQTEVVNRSLETYLRCFAAEQPKNWSFWLPWAEFWHNTSFHVSTNTTPFGVVYGRAPPTILKYVPGEIHCEAVASDLQDRDEALKQLKYHLARAQERLEMDSPTPSLPEKCLAVREVTKKGEKVSVVKNVPNRIQLLQSPVFFQIIVLKAASNTWVPKIGHVFPKSQYLYI
nr:retrotransposon-related protein [Tanacetum cinerariifolium]